MACYFVSIFLLAAVASAQVSKPPLSSGVAAAPLGERCRPFCFTFPTAILAPIQAPQASSQVKPHNLPAKYDLARIGSRGIGDGFNLYSIQREVAVGRELAKQIESESCPVNDPGIIEYVNRITQNLVRHSDAKFPITIKVINSDDVNIYSLPGGFLFVNTGFLLAVESEAELAGAIAHEIAHTAARHATKNQSRKRMVHFVSMPLSLVSGGLSDAVIEPIAFTKFSRDAEREADLLGLEYTYAAGYDPTELTHLFERLREQGGQRTSFIGRLFHTHPMTDQRIRRAQKEIKSFFSARDVYVVTTSDFDNMKARLAKPLHR